ncbi:MAG: transglutaminase domain-containing protein [Planctomycetota bacterium]
MLRTASMERPCVFFAARAVPCAATWRLVSRALGDAPRPGDSEFVVIDAPAVGPTPRGRRCGLPRSLRGLGVAAVLASSLSTLGAQPDPDSDGDGLSDFHEVHKYLTDPHARDSDGDGVLDGDWRERREYAYTVRSVLQVMRPVTPEFLCDDYQDARVLDETPEYVELEVVHYPFNTVASALVGDADWRQHTGRLRAWLEPGPTSDWTPELRHAIEVGLRDDGIDAGRLDDKDLAEQASRWLLRRAKYQDGFSTFMTSFDAAGKPYLPAALRALPGAPDAVALAELWPREVSAAGMFAARQRGSCSSSAIYLSGCLRALGLPTRTVLVVPIVDATDERELTMVKRLTHHEVRRTLLAAAAERTGKWASHTFNEVYVGGRWRRLNYDRLGQNTYDRDLFGLATHVATFRDWADARMPETIGRRQQAKIRDDVFGGTNPYSTITLRDEFGPHCRVPNPPLAGPQRSPARAEVVGVAFGDDPSLPPDVLAWFVENDAAGLVARVEGLANGGEVREFLRLADARVYLTAAGKPRLSVGFDAGCWWFKGKTAFICLPFGAADRRDFATGVPYTFAPRNDAKGATWTVAADLRVERK